MVGSEWNCTRLEQAGTCETGGKSRKLQYKVKYIIWSPIGYLFLNKYPTQFVLKYELCLKPSNCHVMCQAWDAVFLISNTHRRWCGPFFQKKSFFETFHWNTNIVSWIKLWCWILVSLASFSFLGIRCKLTKILGSSRWIPGKYTNVPADIFLCIFLKVQGVFFQNFIGLTKFTMINWCACLTKKT